MQWQQKNFRVYAKNNIAAGVIAMLKAAKDFSLEDWEYDYQNITCDEISQEDILKNIEANQKTFQKESNKRLNQLSDELKAAYGINLPKLPEDDCVD